MDLGQAHQQSSTLGQVVSTALEALWYLNKYCFSGSKTSSGFYKKVNI